MYYIYFLWWGIHIPWRMCRSPRTVCRVSTLLPPETELRSLRLVKRTLPIDPSQQPEVSGQTSSPLSLPDPCAKVPLLAPPMLYFYILFTITILLRLSTLYPKMLETRSGSAFRSENICIQILRHNEDSTQAQKGDLILFCIHVKQTAWRQFDGVFSTLVFGLQPIS